MPAGVTTRDVEYYSGLLTAAGANRTQKEAFLAGTEPQREHGPQWNSILNLPWYQQKAFYLPKQGEEMQPAPEGPGAPAAGPRQRAQPGGLGPAHRARSRSSSCPRWQKSQ